MNRGLTARRRTIRAAGAGMLLLSFIAWALPIRAETPAPAAEDPALRDYLSANGMLNRGLYELAAVEYRKFLDAHSDHAKAPVARYGLAVSLFRLKQFEPALEELRRLTAAKDFEYAAEVRVMQGQCHLAAKAYGPAAEAFESLLASQPKHDLADDAAAGLIEALYGAGKHEDAVARAESFSNFTDGPPAARIAYFAGLSLMAKGDFASAGERFDAVLKADAKGPLAEPVAPLLAQCRQRGELDRGRALFEDGKLEAAQESFEKLVRQKGDLADAGAYWAAKCLLRRGEFADAARAYEKAARQHSESALLPEMHYDRAVALLKAGQDDRAVEVLGEFISRFAEHNLAAEALHLLAVTHHQAKRYDPSRTHCREFLAKYPTHERAAAVAFLLAENDFLAGQYEAATEAYRAYLDAYADDAQAAAARFRLGMAYHRLQKPEEAIRWLVQVVGGPKIEEPFRTALWALGDLQFQRGEWKDAERSLSGYVALADDLPYLDDALLKLGLALQRQDRHEDAIESYDLLLGRFPKSDHRTQALFDRGQALLALKKLEEAAAAFERVLAEGKDSRFVAPALNHLGSIALQRQDFARAAEYFGQLGHKEPEAETAADALLKRGEALLAAGQYKPAEEAFTDFLSKNASHSQAGRARARQAIALSRDGRREQALKVIKTISTEALAALDPSLRQSILYEKAWCLRESGDLESAGATYRALLADGSPAGGLTAHAALELAELEAAAKRYEPAVALLAPIADSESAPPQVREQASYRRAVCEFELGRHESAAEKLEKFLDVFAASPLVPSARLFAGEALFKLGRHDRAAAHLARIAEQSKDDPACAPALLRLGECLAARQKWARSEQAFRDYLDRFDKSDLAYQARFGVGWARENQSRYDEAIAAYREVVSTHQGPTAARAQFQIGECLFAQKKYDDAVRELLKVDILYAYPEWSAAALYEAGRCFEKLGKAAEAREQLKAVQDKYADTAWAKKAADLLAATPAETLPGR